ncbi:MAG: hypothetical protein R3F54_16895 [Alphaproteobacteria bacterium]
MAPVLHSSATITIDSDELTALLAETAPAFPQAPPTAADVAAWLDQTVRLSLAMREGGDAISVIDVGNRVIITGQSRDPDQAMQHASDAAERALAFVEDGKAALRQEFVAFVDRQTGNPEDERGKAHEETTAKQAAAIEDTADTDAAGRRLLTLFVNALDDARTELRERMTAISQRSVSRDDAAAGGSPDATALRERELEALRRRYLGVAIEMGRLRDVQRRERPPAAHASPPSPSPPPSASDDVASALGSATWDLPLARMTNAAKPPAVPFLWRLPVQLPVVLALGLLLGLAAALLVTRLLDRQDDEGLSQSEEVFEHPRWPII